MTLFNIEILSVSSAPLYPYVHFATGIVTLFFCCWQSFLALSFIFRLLLPYSRYFYLWILVTCAQKSCFSNNSELFISDPAHIFYYNRQSAVWIINEFNSIYIISIFQRKIYLNSGVRFNPVCLKLFFY